MIINLEFAPSLDLGILWRFEDSSMGLSRPSKASQKLAEKILPEVIDLVKPTAYIGFFPVQGFANRRLELENGLALTGGFIAHILGEAQEIAVIVCTIGNELEVRAKEYFAGGRPARGYILDALGTVALGNLAEDARSYTEARINERGLQASTPISPGHADWALSEQQILFKMLPTRETGVLLNSSFLMQPRKSLTMVLGLGKKMLTHAEGSQCEYCGLAKTCTYRRVPGDPWYPIKVPSEEASMKNV
ncbi:hypothetical protein ACFLZW_06140 [Chloroflexota bacterium]